MSDEDEIMNDAAAPSAGQAPPRGILTAPSSSSAPAASPQVADTLTSLVHDFGHETPSELVVHRSMEWLKRRPEPALRALPGCITNRQLAPVEYICLPRKPLAQLPVNDLDGATFRYAAVDLTKAKHDNGGRRPNAAGKPIKSKRKRKARDPDSVYEDRLQQGLKVSGVRKVLAKAEVKTSLLFVRAPRSGYVPVASYIVHKQPPVLAYSPMYCTGRPHLVRGLGRGRQSQTLLSAPHPMVEDPKECCGEVHKARNPDDTDYFYKYHRCVSVLAQFDENHQIVDQLGPANIRFARQKGDKRDSMPHSSSSDSNITDSRMTGAAPSSPSSSPPPPRANKRRRRDQRLPAPAANTLVGESVANNGISPAATLATLRAELATAVLPEDIARLTCAVDTMQSLLLVDDDGDVPMSSSQP